MSRTQTPRHYAIVGAGMAGVACARTLLQAGHRVTVFEKSPGAGGRMATRETPLGGFDHGAQYFTVRDPRFARALETVPGLVRPWSASSVRVLDALGHVLEAAPPPREPHLVPVPGMNALPRAWGQPLGSALLTRTRVDRIERDAIDRRRWQLHTEAPGGIVHVHGGYDAVLLALPAPQAAALLDASALAPKPLLGLHEVKLAPCWTLMVAFPNAMQPGLGTLGPQWNAARSTHHRVAWLARESSKPQRAPIERWTVQASAAWSHEHLEDEPARVEAKLQRAFAEITGIRATPGHSAVHRWRYAKTLQPLGQSHLWDAKSGLGACGDWCLGHRVEDAFISGLSLALAVL
ncbi:FAD-dependent oxidoreductase [Tibeticola sp.]|jgi:hypothetical protein|uniref:NAD(P)/FAD-dependent oxidoreductase n=1 Tax=Tibeticola sp. TaxID=2005368 RepID=UPI0025855B3A|nr:FAD-dependent oxidoreductase [Tibeticola sp.]MCI4441615.1 FAD-dependent oxidoreductase [Tibeticola sp.]